MGQVIIQEFTPKNPLEIIGQESGICYHSDVSNREKNIKRGKNCIKSGHYRTMEYAQVFMVLSDYSAKLIREVYTAIGGMPTRLQESTRYVNFKDGFDYWTPKSIAKNEKLNQEYNELMDKISEFYGKALDANIKPEDASSILPLAMDTTVVVRTNARHLMDMSRQRMCSRAWKPYRQLMNQIISALGSYSGEWKWICDNTLMAKCDALGYCPEMKSCGRYPRRDDVNIVLKMENKPNTFEYPLTQFVPKEEQKSRADNRIPDKEVIYKDKDREYTMGEMRELLGIPTENGSIKLEETFGPDGEINE